MIYGLLFELKLSYLAELHQVYGFSKYMQSGHGGMLRSSSKIGRWSVMMHNPRCAERMQKSR